MWATALAAADGKAVRPAASAAGAGAAVPRASLVVVAAAAVLAGFAGPCTAGEEDGATGTVSVDIQAGRDGYRDGVAAVSVSPVPDFTLDVRAGAGRSGTESGDSGASLGAGVAMMLVGGVTLSVGYDSCREGRGYLLSPALDAVVGEVPSPQANRTLSCDLSVDPLSLAGRGEEESDEDAGGILDYVRLDAGMAGGHESVPVRREGGVRTASFTIPDRVYSGGVSAGLGGTDFSAYHRRHHRGKPAPPADFDRLPPALAGRVLERVRAAVSQVTAEPPLWETGVTMNEPVSDAVSVFGSFELARLAVTGTLSRTFRAEASFRPMERLTLRAGACWVREYGGTTPYGVAGAAWRFR